MKFFRAVAPRWYGHVNDATIAISTLIILAYLSFEQFFPNAKEEISLTIPLTTLAFAGVALLYCLALYRFLAHKSHMFAGLISYMLLSITLGTLIAGTGGMESQLLALWMIPAILSYMFGVPILALMWLVTNASLIFAVFGSSDTEISRVLLYFITLQLPFMVSFMIWRRSEVGKAGSDDKSAFANKDLSADLLIESIAEGVVVIDIEGVIQLFNKAAEDITGWKRGDALTLNYKSVIKLATEKGEDIPAESDPIKNILATGESAVNNELAIRTHSDKIVEVTLVLSPLKDQTGAVKAVVVVFRDVAEERKTQRQRAEFISTASHEMRTPVAAIEGYLALAMNEKVAKIDSAARGHLEKAHASTQHLGKLFQDLLTAAKSEDGRLTNNPVVTDMGAFLEQLVEDMKFSAEKKGLKVIQNFGAGSMSANGKPSMNPVYLAHIDPERMREVITNLFDNAVKYTEEGKITIGFTGTQDTVKISISDTGAGIPPEDISHLFQKFYRVDNTSTRQIGGTGLGLFICKKIVELYNGRIWVESKLGEGSTFFIELPRLDQAKADQLKQLEAAQNSPLSGSPQPGQTVNAK